MTRRRRLAVGVGGAALAAAVAAAAAVRLGAHRVRSGDTRAISDHFPVVAEVVLP